MTTQLLDSIKECESVFIRVIRNRLGIVIHKHQTRELHKTILEACRKFKCQPEEYLQNLMVCTDDSPLIEHLVLGVTVGETYFFRDRSQMELLQNVLLPRLIKLKREQRNLSLRIWSAGCATGEEIYTIAIMLAELLPDIKAWSLNLLATDINTASLKKAMTGCYTSWSMRAISSRLKQRYFSEINRKYTISEEIRSIPEFMYLNLNDDYYPSILNGINAFDLILCRNVLIYFDSESTEHLMKKLSISLVDGGYLLLGASDPISLTGIHLDFHHKDGLLFSRPHSRPVMNELINIENQVDIKKPVTPRREIVSQDKKILKKHPIQKLHVIPAKKISEKTICQNDEDTINKLLAESRWQETLDTIDRYTENEKKLEFALIARATALANLGTLDEAVKSCEESLKINKMNKQTYLIYAMVLLELNHFDKAENELRKVIFLDRNFVIAHFQLGLLLFRKNQYELGLKSLKNALVIATRNDPSSLVVGSVGLDYGTLSEILKKEIDIFTMESVNHAN